jgi:CBS domain containing-hemolysin-like protein
MAVKEPIGIITLEDIIEALTGKDIDDEMDNDNEKGDASENKENI